MVIGGVAVLVHNRPAMEDGGYWNYLLKRDGIPYYSGMAGPNETPASVRARHTNNTDKSTGINRGRFTPGIDTFEPIPGQRTYGEARLMEDRLAIQHDTIIGRDGYNWLGNRQRPMAPGKVDSYLKYEAGLGGGC